MILLHTVAPPGFRPAVEFFPEGLRLRFRHRYRQVACTFRVSNGVATRGAEMRAGACDSPALAAVAVSG